MKKKAKIILRIETKEEVYIESAWAVKIDDYLYRLESNLFYTYDLSRKDIIEAFPTKNGILEYSRTIEKSGHKTVRMILDPPADESDKSQRVLDTLNELGCKYEGATPSYLSIAIPPETELMEIREFLIDSGVQWEHADPRYNKLFPSIND